MSSESAPHSRASTYEWVGHPPSFHQPAGGSAPAASSPPQPTAAPRGLQYPPLTDLHRAPLPGGHKSPPPGTFPQHLQQHPPLIDLAEPERERPPIPSRPAVVPVAMWDTLAPAAALAKLRPAAEPAAARPVVPQVETEPDLLRVETELTRAETDLSLAHPALRIDTATARSPSPEVPSVPDVAANVDLASPMLSGPFSPYPTVEKERSISTVSVAGSTTAAPRKGTSTAAEPATSTTSSRSPSPPSAAARPTAEVAAVPVTESVLGLTPATPVTAATAATTPPRSPTMRPATAPVDRTPSLSLPPSASVDPTSAAALLDANCTLTWQVRRARHAARRAASAAADLAALVREERRVDDALRIIAARQFELADRLFHLTAQRERDRAQFESDQMRREMSVASRLCDWAVRNNRTYVQLDDFRFVERGYTPDQHGRMRPFARYVTPLAEYTFSQVEGELWPREEAVGGGERQRPWLAAVAAAR
ncbi:hypothetical protein GGF31_003835 [Allomyces arbusculus]|nr:hypothetical protein GGF31_003835 [Allomyces arbusculus]